MNSLLTMFLLGLTFSVFSPQFASARDRTVTERTGRDEILAVGYCDAYAAYDVSEVSVWKSVLPIIRCEEFLTYKTTKLRKWSIWKRKKIPGSETLSYERMVTALIQEGPPTSYYQSHIKTIEQCEAERVRLTSLIDTGNRRSKCSF